MSVFFYLDVSYSVTILEENLYVPLKIGHLISFYFVFIMKYIKHAKYSKNMEHNSVNSYPSDLTDLKILLIGFRFP